MVIYNTKEVAFIKGNMSVSTVSHGLPGISWGISLLF